VLNVEPSCRAAADANARQSGRNTEVCLRDEQQARDTLKREWDSYNSDDRAHCVRLTTLGGPPSYVELLTCLQVAKDARERPAEDRLEGFGKR
jgi:hypothetical protein